MMAQPFAERLNTALTNDRARTADLEALHAEATAERDRQVTIAKQAAEDSLRLDLSDDETDRAATRAARAKRLASSLADALDKLDAKLAEKRAAADRKAVDDERAAVIAERDALAERFREEWPALEAGMVELLTLNAANVERGRRAGLYQEDAESVARGVPGNYMLNGAAVRQLSKMALPSFAEPRALAWPAPKANQLAAVEEAERRQRLAWQAQQAADEGRWSRYAVQPAGDQQDADKIVIATRRGDVRLGWRTIEAVMTAEGVEAAREAGCIVEPLAANESIGQPSAHGVYV